MGSDTVNDPALSRSPGEDSTTRSQESASRSQHLSKEYSDSRASLEGKVLFNKRSSSFSSRSSKGVSFSDSSFAESERERYLDRERRRAGEKLRAPEPQYRLQSERFAKSKSKRREMRDRRNDDNVASPSRNIPNPPSPESMAYSLDSSSQFRPPQLAPINMNNNDQGSVFTSATGGNESLLSYVTRSTMVQSKFQAESHDEADDDISLSLLESGSSVVPSDDELRAIGWGKALDPSSGVYYYFTLDRTKTVWENPLSPSSRYK